MQMNMCAGIRVIAASAVLTIILPSVRPVSVTLAVALPKVLHLQLSRWRQGCELGEEFLGARQGGGASQ